MEEFSLDDILDDAQIEELFTEPKNENPPKETQENTDTNPTEVNPEELFGGEEPEIVGGDEPKKDTTSSENSSPTNFYSSIAKSLVEDGILSNNEELLKTIDGPEKFSEFIENHLKEQLDERQRRIDEALGLGIEVGLDVTDNISVSLSQVLADEQPTQLGVNYRVNDNLLIRGATGLGSESEIRFEYEVQF